MACWTPWTTTSEFSTLHHFSTIGRRANFPMGLAPPRLAHVHVAVAEYKF